METAIRQTTYRALSLGAGVQSSVLALLLSRQYHDLGLLDYPTPDCAIFADTGWEPQYVYEHLDWLESQLSYPLIRVSAGNIKKKPAKSGNRNRSPLCGRPVFLIES